MTALAFLGDPHGDLAAMRRFVVEHPKVPRIVLGDMGLARPVSWALPETFWVPGNHDFDDETQYDATLGDPLALAWCLHGRVTEVCGLQVAGLGGNFQTRIWNPKHGDGQPRWRRRQDFLRHVRPGGRWRVSDGHDIWGRKWGFGLPLKARGAIWPEDYDRLAGQRADVLVLHEAPSTHEHGFKALDQLAEAMRVRLVVHGHHHRAYKGFLPSGIRVIGVGLAESRLVDMESAT